MSPRTMSIMVTDGFILDNWPSRFCFDWEVWPLLADCLGRDESATWTRESSRTVSA
jgi:hypothetical protein